MSQFGFRRGRLKTNQLRPSSYSFAEVLHQIRDRHISLQLLLCLMALIAMVISVQAWRLPFPYHLGQKVPGGIAARVDFERIDRVATDRAREVNLASVPYIFSNNPAALKVLPQELKTALKPIASAKSLESLPPETVTSFGLGVQAAGGADGTPGVTLKDAEVRFQRLRAIAMDERKTDDLVLEFTKFLEPVMRSGVLVERPTGLQDIKPDSRIAVRRPGNRDDLGYFSEVSLRSLLAPDGGLSDAWASYPAMNSLRPMLESWILVHLKGTLTYDDVATQEARQKAREQEQPVTSLYKKGDLLVGPNVPITADHLALLEAEHAAVQMATPSEQKFIRIATVTLMILILMVVNGYYLIKNHPLLARSPSRLSIYLTALVLAVALGRVLALESWRAEVIPILAAVMVFAIAYNQVLATITAFSLSLIITMSMGGSLSEFVMLMSASATAVVMLARVSSRSTLIKVGFWSGVSYFIMFWGTEIIRAESVRALFQDYTVLSESLYGAGWCLASGFLVAGSLPFIESAFGMVTDISLLELGDVSHPLLQELVRRAPGTYNHSITMASIAETAADAIGANGLLVRVGAYFHDIGKMLKPQYFVENVTEGNASRHSHLAPAMSTLIIIGHVKDGIDLAHQYGLPQPLIDFVEQHHGTTLVEYFYHAATKNADQNPDHKREVQESSFRYPGPKPQTREAGVMMLADAVESASRTLSEPTPKRIERLVHEIAMKRLLDGQFEESSLTMTELHLVQQSLVKSLIGIYHGRIKYPEQRTA
ncbi:MAG: HDIG domain-containing protein [Planctomycetales bacterium]